MPIPTAKHPPSSPRIPATTPRLLTASDLCRATFAEFGDVAGRIECEPGGEGEGLKVVEANQGSARKVVDVSGVTNFYDQCESGEEGRCVVNLFVCQPRKLVERHGRAIFPVTVLERHPFTAQMFVPMGVRGVDEGVRYLVIVAPTLPSKNGGGVSAVLHTSTNDDTPSTTSNVSRRSPGPARKGPGLPDLGNIKAFIAKGDQAVTYAAGTWHAPMVVLGQRAIDFVVVQHSNGVASEDCEECHIGSDGFGDIAVDVSGVATLKASL